MIKTFSPGPGQPLTDQQLGEIEEARPPIVFDKDCEEPSPAMIKAFKSAAIRQDHIKPNPREAVLLIGLQASGKSTFYRQILKSADCFQCIINIPQRYPCAVIVRISRLR